MSDLCTLAEAKNHLNLSTTMHDSELEKFVTVASDLVEAKAKRVWRDTAYTERHSGGTEDIVLFHSPVKSITSIVDGGSTVSASEYTLIPETGLIHLNAGVFTARRYQLVATYVAGAAAVPPLVNQATLETLRHLWQTQRGTVNRANITGDDYSPLTTFSMPNRVVELIQDLAFHGGLG